MIFTAPVFADGKLAKPARVTMFHNSVLVHLNEEIHGEIGHRILPEYKQKASQGPLLLSGHGCPVRFRNIWVATVTEIVAADVGGSGSFPEIKMSLLTSAATTVTEWETENLPCIGCLRKLQNFGQKSSDGCSVG
jgi:hypothetical protein